MDIGSRRQLFIDDRFIESQTGITLRMNPPVKVGPALLQETELEARGLGFVTVLEAGGRYLMYYRGSAAPDAPVAKPQHHQDEVRQPLMCLATSDDGVSWRREKVGLHEVNGSTDNNVVMRGCEGIVFIDPNATNDCPFWWFGIIRSNTTSWEQARGAVYGWSPQKEGGLYLMCSRDGVQWERVPDAAVPFLCDTHNQCFCDTRLNKYVAYVRGWHPQGQPGDRGRTVCRTETDALLDLPWPHQQTQFSSRGPHGLFGNVRDELPIVMQADELDPPGTDLYTPAVHQYPYADDAYFSFTSPYRHYDGFDSHGRDTRGTRVNTGLVEIACAVSRDGVAWHRFREPYVRPGLIGQLDGGSMYMGSGMMRKGDELWQYYTGNAHAHDTGAIVEGEPHAMIGRLVQRLDGFASADAGPKGGELSTPVLTFAGDRLLLNIDCGALGEAWVELLDEAGRPIPGHTMDEAVSVDRNGTAQEVWWQDGPDVSKIAGRRIRLRFRMRSAKLYAFEFAAAQ